MRTVGSARRSAPLHIRTAGVYRFQECYPDVYSATLGIATGMVAEPQSTASAPYDLHGLGLAQDSTRSGEKQTPSSLRDSSHFILRQASRSLDGERSVLHTKGTHARSDTWELHPANAGCASPSKRTATEGLSPRWLFLLTIE